MSSLFYIDETGIHIPDFEEIRNFLKSQFRNVYGEDVYLESDSIDGQWIDIIAAAIYDDALTGQKAYFNIAPYTASGDALSRIVQINGISRKEATNSQVDLEISVNAGTIIDNGIAEDINGNNWLLPETLNFSSAGIYTVHAYAQNVGEIQAVANSINKIKTPTSGWLTVNNPLPATPGVNQESDPSLRVRQKQSVSLPAQSILDSLYSGIASLDGVTKVILYENDTNVQNDKGLPPHSICAVVEGGDPQEIGETIYLKKTPGGYTFGSQEVVVDIGSGLTGVYRFERAINNNMNITFGFSGTPNTQALRNLIELKIKELIDIQLIGTSLSVNELTAKAQEAMDELNVTGFLNYVRVDLQTGDFGFGDIIFQPFNRVLKLNSVFLNFN